MATVHPIVQGRVVGALACQRDSYLRSLETEVVSCEKWSPPDADLKATKKKSVETQNISDIWLIELADSVLFPEGTSLTIVVICALFTAKRSKKCQAAASQRITALYCR
jgi:hypothetical protein